MENFYEIKPEDLNESTFKLIGKDWMLITAEKEGKVNTMTASWGGFGVMWNKNVAYIVVRPQRYTKEFIDAAENFSLTFFDGGYKKELGYLGAVSGRDENKIEKCNLTVIHEGEVPYFGEAKMAIMCKKLYAQEYKPECFIDKSIPLTVYPNNDYHTLYIGEITKVLVGK